ncbi:hypothetical protein T4D_14886 [Trichinella pseudospiralis]|uniref:Uncharacterized protein n=1 Tax=Trichinella pseudospiralis TaxID=6337 RepID=A0A0V1FN75_TRIPS|nr:hypothetical protein T4D_14886 [Trichinella pseudospiralis]
MKPVRRRRHADVDLDHNLVIFLNHYLGCSASYYYIIADVPEKFVHASQPVGPIVIVDWLSPRKRRQLSLPPPPPPPPPSPSPSPPRQRH